MALLDDLRDLRSQLAAVTAERDAADDRAASLERDVNGYRAQLGLPFHKEEPASDYELYMAARAELTEARAKIERLRAILGTVRGQIDDVAEALRLPL